jgi:hypothetical protein
MQTQNTVKIDKVARFLYSHAPILSYLYLICNDAMLVLLKLARVILWLILDFILIFFLIFSPHMHGPHFKALILCLPTVEYKIQQCSRTYQLASSKNWKKYCTHSAK